MKKKGLISSFGLVLLVVIVLGVQTVKADAPKPSDCGFDVDNVCCIAGTKCSCSRPH